MSEIMLIFQKLQPAVPWLLHSGTTWAWASPSLRKHNAEPELNLLKQKIISGTQIGIFMIFH